MKKLILLLLLFVLAGFLSDLILVVSKRTNSSKKSAVYTIKKMDTSGWKLAQLHQDITTRIPEGWSSGTDGIYNYDYLSVTGIRDKNFPENSFKCVFYSDSTLRPNITINNVKILNSDPYITYNEATWEGEDLGISRKHGEPFNFYSYIKDSREIYSECNVFKGSMSADDQAIFENIILALE